MRALTAHGCSKQSMLNQAHALTLTSGTAPDPVASLCLCPKSEPPAYELLTNWLTPPAPSSPWSPDCRFRLAAVAGALVRNGLITAPSNDALTVSMI